MPRRVLEFRCFLISPGDLMPERDLLTEQVRRWNAQVGVRSGNRVELVRWESHSVPDLSDSPQGVINKQILEQCDLGVALFWSRLGTPTTDHPSGSLEEIERLRAKGKRVLIYFCDRPIPLHDAGSIQVEQLRLFRERISRDGLVGSFRDATDLGETFSLHLTNIITELAAGGDALVTSSAASAKTYAGSSAFGEVSEELAKALAFIELALRGYAPARRRTRRRNTERRPSPAIEPFDCYILDREPSLAIAMSGHLKRTRHFYVPKESLIIDAAECFYLFASFGELYERPDYFIVPAAVVSKKAAKMPGAPNYFTFPSGMTVDVTDHWHFNDYAEEYLEAWHLLGKASGPNLA